MARGAERKDQEARQPCPEPEVLVRSAKVVPTIEQQPVAMLEEEAHDNGLPCSGRCGHCDYHPCRLHAPI